MSTIRWIHRKDKNLEKKIVSLNELKEKYYVDNIKEKNVMHFNDAYEKKIYEKEKSLKEKEKKKDFNKHFKIKTRPEINLKNECVEKNKNLYLNKKKINEKNENESRRNCSSDVYRRIIEEDIDGNKVKNYIMLNNQNEEKEKENLNINLDINIQWGKKNNNYENKKSNNNKYFLQNNINLKDIEDKLKYKHNNLYIEEDFTNTSYLSDSLIEHDVKNKNCNKERKKIYEEFYSEDEEIKKIHSHKSNMKYNEKETKNYECNNEQERDYHYIEERPNHYEEKYNQCDKKKLKNENETKYKPYDEKRQYICYNEENDYYQCDEKKKCNYYDEKKYNYYNEENIYCNYDESKVRNYRDTEKIYYNNYKSDEDTYYNCKCKIKENKYHSIHDDIEKKYYNKENKTYCNIEKEKKNYKRDDEKKFYKEDLRKDSSDYEEKKTYNQEEFKKISHMYKGNKIDNYIKKKNYIKVLNDDKNVHSNLKRFNTYLTSYKKKDNIILSTNYLNQLFLSKVNAYFIFFKNFFLKNYQPIYKTYNKVGNKDILLFKNKEAVLLIKKNTEKNYTLDSHNEKEFLSMQDILRNNKEYNKEKNETEIFKPNIDYKKEKINNKKTVYKSFNFNKNLYKNKVLNNTLIDSFNDVDLNDQKRKKKYLKFFVILLSLFLKKYIYKHFSKFFFIIGSLSRKHVEKREIRKYINIKIYSLSLLETILNKKKRENSMLVFHFLKKKSINLKKNKEEEKSGKIDLKTNIYNSKNFFENLCFGKPKLYGTDDFTIFYKKKILKEKDEIFQKCLLRSKSDSLLDFLKCSKINKLSRSFSKKNSVGISDEVKNSTLLERFYTATYNLKSNNLNKNMCKSKINLSCFGYKNDTDLKYTNFQNRNNNSNKEKQIYANSQKEESYEIVSNNNSSNSLIDNKNEYSVDTSKYINSFADTSKYINSFADTSKYINSFADTSKYINSFADTSKYINSFADTSKYIKSFADTSKYISSFTDANKDIKYSSDEDIYDKNCRIFFKNIKKELKINYKKTVDIDSKDKDLSLSDLNSPVDFTKKNKTHLFHNSEINLHEDSITNLNFLTNSDLRLINNFSEEFSK